ncbi:uncharacterized protein UTRI_10441_B [Ustilago trichophora]|uniref:Uncharacterized protein n=1 Tax=Ustilago trichophora TaxID=86804 RepID=A0A5C3EBN0_9BASI|nr:uncharacterized protein UTRI_10441_B [Ustilago trichophora]
MLNLISAPRYPTTSGKKEESMVIVARTLIDSLPRVAHYRAVSKASSRSSRESSFEVESEEEKVALLSTIPKSLKHASSTIRSSYGSIINTDKRSESRKVALKSSISRPIPHSHQCTFDKTQIQTQDEMDSRGSLYSNHSWSDKVEKLSVSPFEFDLDQQQNSDNQAGEKAIRRVSVESFASSERCYGFF